VNPYWSIIPNKRYQCFQRFLVNISEQLKPSGRLNWDNVTVEKAIYAYMHILTSNMNSKIKNLNEKNIVNRWKMIQFVGSGGN
jgi:hypothetical protein